MMRLHLLVAFFFCLAFETTLAQDKKLVQFSGIITTPDTSAFVPYVTITNKTTNKQPYIANYKGYFSFTADEGDTLVFSAVGYHSLSIVIPNGISQQRYTLMVKMKPTIITLPVVTIYPWASVEEFTREFLSMKTADDDLALAKKNLSRSSNSTSYTSVPRDEQEIQLATYQSYHTTLSNKNINQNYANPLLNPFAWKSFLEQIFQGDKNNRKNQ